MPSLPPTLVSLCLHSHAFCLPQLVVVLPLVIHPLPLQLLGTPPPPFQRCLHLSWLRCLMSCPSSCLVQLPLVRLDCFSRHHLLLLVRLPSAGATTSHCATASSSYCALSCLLSPWLVVEWKATAATTALSSLFPTFPATVPIASTSCPHPLLPRW